MWTLLTLFSGGGELLNAQSTPELGLSWTGDAAQLRVSGPVGSRARIDYRSALSSTEAWAAFAEVPLPAGMASLIDLSGGGEATRFYRAEFTLPDLGVSGRVLFVRTDGDDQTAEPDRADRPWGSVTNALAMAQNGDTILVYPGTYVVKPALASDGEIAPLRIRYLTNVVLQAMGEAVIHGEEDGDFFLLERCQNIVISGFDIVGRYEEDPGQVTTLLRAAIRFQSECSNVLVENNRILNHINHGIAYIKGLYLPPTNNIVVRNNYIENVGHYFTSLPVGGPRYDGTAIVPAGGWRVEGNVIVGCARGVEPYPNDEDISPFCVIRDNTIIDVADFGISSGGSLGNHYTLVEGNHIETRSDFVFHGRPLEVAAGIDFSTAPNIRVRNNTIIGFLRAGIYMFSSEGMTNAIIEGNTIRGSGSGHDHGIAIGDRNGEANNFSGIVIRNNTISEVGFDGISFQGRDSLLEGNLIMNASRRIFGRSGIHLRSYGQAAHTSNVVVRFNHIADYGPLARTGPGILIDSGCRNISLLGNTFQGINNQIDNRAGAGVVSDGLSLSLGATNLTSYLVVSNTLQAAGLVLREGEPDSRLGAVRLAAGEATVPTTSVTEHSRIMLTVNQPSGQVGTPYVQARTPGLSFTIQSTSAADESEVAWVIIEPATTGP